MGKRCCCASCCCCCGKRGATVTFSLVGLALASAVIAAPLYVYHTDGDFQKLFPVLQLSKDFLRRVTERRGGGGGGAVSYPGDQVGGSTNVSEEGGFGRTEWEVRPEEKYKLAIFQLLDDIQANAPYLALVSFSIGCLNVPIHLMLLSGAAFKIPCLMLPWLAVTLLEHIVIGVPFIVFFGIISLYLAAQLQLYLVAGAVVGSCVLLFLLSLSSWFTVHNCYTMFYARQDCYYYGEGGGGTPGASMGDATQPLLPAAASSSRGGGAPAPPPGHPSSGGYQLGQYPQYYPPHHNQSRQLPTAPPSSGGVYPQLPNA